MRLSSVFWVKMQALSNTYVSNRLKKPNRHLIDQNKNRISFINHALTPLKNDFLYI